MCRTFRRFENSRNVEMSEFVGRSQSDLTAAEAVDSLEQSRYPEVSVHLNDPLGAFSHPSLQQ
jgi:hypothetical protein